MSIQKPIEIENFVRQYITSLESLITGLYSEVKELKYKRNFPIEFPVSTKIYQNNRGIWIYFIKSEFFSFQIISNPLDNVKCSQFLTHKRFSYFKDKGSLKAKMDVEQYIRIPDMIENHDDVRYHDEYDNYKNMSDELDYYFSFMKKSQEIMDETKINKFYEVYNMFEMVIHYFSRYEKLLDAGCHTMCILLPMLNVDIETALFLALHGKYYSSISIYRKILEVTIRAIYLDSYLNSNDSLIEIKKEWLQGEPFKYKFPYIINKLLSNIDNNNITNILHELDILHDNNLKNRIGELYKELSKYVHLRPPKHLYDTPILFSEYDEKKFIDVFKYNTEILKYTDIVLFMKFPEILVNGSFAEFPEFSYEEYNKLKEKLCIDEV